MKREILFRGKSIQNGKWLYGNIQIPEAPYDEYFMWDNGWQMQVDPDTIGQYTGLIDKNGMEIYEGDIIESKRYRHIVMYDKNLAGFCSANVKYPEDLCGLNQQWINECGKVVIGNVTDNPELLK